jgi:hypothetical protein
MAASQVLGDSAHSNVQTHVKYGRIRKIYINAAIGATGAITVTAADTDDGEKGAIAVSRTSTGLYAVTNLPTSGGKSVLASGGSIINDDTTPTAADARIVTWGPISLSAGTASILTTAGDDGDVSDPTSGTTLQAWLEIKCGT